MREKTILHLSDSTTDELAAEVGREAILKMLAKPELARIEHRPSRQIVIEVITF